MDDVPIRTYTANEVYEIVELLRDSHEVSAEHLSGMERLAEILKYFETKTDEDIETEICEIYRSIQVQ